jgi:hypothetical protein
MASYISSNANRFYTKLETAYGVSPAISATNRLSAVKLTTKQELDVAVRKDKTGSRTFGGTPQGARRKTSFDLKTYMSSWPAGTDSPGAGPLMQAALGATPLISAGGTVSGITNNTQISFTGAHGLVANQAVSFGSELRFVAAVVDASNVIINAPFSVQPPPGATLSGTITYLPATELPSVSIFDYWSPATAVQRILNGAAIDKMSLNVNGDYHEFEFSGIAKDLIDSSSFESGDAGLTSFPAEPALCGIDLSVVPGNLGQIWLGAIQQQFLTVTEANLQVANDLDSRAREFGSAVPLATSPGKRSVSFDFSLFEKDDDATAGLYQAARQRSPISVMLQLGQSSGQLFGVYLKSLIPEIPSFDDSERRLQWRFQKSRAQGTHDDEVAVAFA